jgi:alkylated DNA repair protein (DNA oxidative demethylase)
MSNCGSHGWLSDRSGYRYTAVHPVTGAPWPEIPHSVLELWYTTTGLAYVPQACLINYYGATAKLGLHRDQDEEARDAPILSISLGDTAMFRLGGSERKSPTRLLRLGSGDLLILSGPSRHWFHGVDRILPGTSRLLPEGGRINLTLRRVTPP